MLATHGGTHNSNTRTTTHLHGGNSGTKLIAASGHFEHLLGIVGRQLQVAHKQPVGVGGYV